jgi:hypothetical protein
MIRFNFYNDRSPAGSLPDVLSEKLKARGLVSPEGQHLISFCGMQIDSDGINIFLPRSSKVDYIDNQSQIKIASQLMLSIERYGRESLNAIDQMDEGQGIIGIDQLSLIKALLVDYRNNGI